MAHSGPGLHPDRYLGKGGRSKQGSLAPTHKYHKRRRNRGQSSGKRSTEMAFSSLPSNRLSRLSHEELMIPLVYWTGPPQHRVSAMFIQRSSKTGDILVTGSLTGEILIWRTLSSMIGKDHISNRRSSTGLSSSSPPTALLSADPLFRREQWIPTALTMSTNTTAVVSLLANVQYKEQASLVAVHADGEAVVLSIYGAAALKTGRGDRPLISAAVRGVYGIDNDAGLNPGLIESTATSRSGKRLSFTSTLSAAMAAADCSFGRAICTDFSTDSVHLVDFNKGKQLCSTQPSFGSGLGSHRSAASEAAARVAGTGGEFVFGQMFYSRGQSLFAAVNRHGKVVIFTVSPSVVRRLIEFETGLASEPKGIYISNGSEYCVVISQNEVVAFKLDPVRFVRKEFGSLSSHWDCGVLLTAVPGVGPSRATSITDAFDNESGRVSRMNRNSSSIGVMYSDPTIHELSSDRRSGIMTDGSMVADGVTSAASSRPQLILIVWQCGAPCLEVYQLSLQGSKMGPFLRLCCLLTLPLNAVECGWQSLSCDSHRLYLATYAGELYHWSLEDIVIEVSRSELKSGVISSDTPMKDQSSPIEIPARLCGSVNSAFDEAYFKDDLVLEDDEEEKTESSIGDGKSVDPPPSSSAAAAASIPAPAVSDDPSIGDSSAKSTAVESLLSAAMDDALTADSSLVSEPVLDEYVEAVVEEEEGEHDHESAELFGEDGEYFQTLAESEEQLTVSCMQVCQAGVLLCLGFADGHVYIYNVTESEPVLEYHTRLSGVSALLMCCNDPSSSSSSSAMAAAAATSSADGGRSQAVRSPADGVLFIGYLDGFVEVINPIHGDRLIAVRAHLGCAVDRLVLFERDYYVFSIGRNDSSFVSFLVYGQLVTMKSIQSLVNKHNGERVRVNAYRSDVITDNVWLSKLYRNDWCLITDLVVAEMTNGHLYLWCVSTAQCERCIDHLYEAQLFKFAQRLPVSSRRGDLPHLTKDEHDVYEYLSSGRGSYLGANVMLLDVRVLGQVSFAKEISMSAQGGLEMEDFSMSAVGRSHSGFAGAGAFTAPVGSSGSSGMAASSASTAAAAAASGVSSGLGIADYRKLSDTLSLLCDWGVSDEVESLFLSSFKSLVCDVSPCFGFVGDYESLTLLLPISSRMGGRWRIQPKVTAGHMLAINTVCMWLLQCAPQEALPVCSRLLTHYHVQLPEIFLDFVEPSRNTMARYCLSSVSEIRAAARMLLEGIIQRMSESTQMTLIQRWRSKFCRSAIVSPSGTVNVSSLGKTDSSLAHHSHHHPSSVVGSSMSGTSMIGGSGETGGSGGGVSLIAHPSLAPVKVSGSGKVPVTVLLAAVMICMINLRGDVSVEELVASSVLNVLISVCMEFTHVRTQSDIIKMSLACDFLGSVMSSWFRLVPDMEYLLRILLDLRTSEHPLLSRSAAKTLLHAGRAMPQSFVKCMGTEALHISKSNRHIQALMCIVALVKKDPLTLHRYLPLTVSTVIRCLDPSAPRRRKALLSATTASLHVLTQKYPNICFHQDSQHFAIGCGPQREYSILIYDLRTTTRWKQLKGHTGSVCAIEFSTDGEYMVSYSATETPPTLRCWYIGSQSFLASLWSSIGSSSGSSAKCVKICVMTALPVLTAAEYVNQVRLSWSTRRKGVVKLTREDGSVLYFTVLASTAANHHSRA